MDENAFRAWNEMMIEKYDPDLYHTRSNFIIRIIIKLLVKTIMKQLSLKSSDRIIEVGCGAGNVLQKLDLSGGKLFGIDISSKLLKKAFNRCSGKVGLIAGNAENLPLQPEKFDKVVCTEVIEHLVSPEKCLSEIVRISKDDAVIVITTTNEMFVNRIKAMIWGLGLEKLMFRGGAYHPDRKMDDEWHLHAFDLKLFNRLLKKYLKVDKIIYVPSLFFPIHMVARCRKKG